MSLVQIRTFSLRLSKSVCIGEIFSLVFVGVCTMSHVPNQMEEFIIKRLP